jgi:hypothetical protein
MTAAYQEWPEDRIRRLFILWADPTVSVMAITRELGVHKDTVARRARLFGLPAERVQVATTDGIPTVPARKAQRRRPRPVPPGGYDGALVRQVLPVLRGASQKRRWRSSWR